MVQQRPLPLLQRALAEEEEEEGRPLKYIWEEKRMLMIEQYENKIRFYSTPEKAFNYFASVQTAEGKFMTVDDLILAITPSMHRETEESSHEINFFSSASAPGASGALMASNISSSSSTLSSVNRTISDSVFSIIDSSGDGLISFEEFLFCQTLLSIPSSSFRIAFDMFDLDGNGTIDANEFETVMRSMRSRSPLTSGKRLERYAESTDGVLDTFFGKDRKNKLRIETFVQFLSDLQTEVISLEFAHYAEEDGLSTEAFIKLVACRSGQLRTYLENTEEANNDHKISLEDFLSLSKFIEEAERAENALDLYLGETEQIDGNLFIRLAKAVSGVSLPSSLVLVLFQAFGAKDLSDAINPHELFSVLRKRAERFRSTPRDGGFSTGVSCVSSCFQEMFM